MTIPGHLCNQRQRASLLEKRNACRTAPTATLRLELLEDRTLPSVSPLAVIAPRPAYLSYPRPVPGVLAALEGAHWLSGPTASALDRLMGQAGLTAAADGASPASQNVAAPLVN